MINLPNQDNVDTNTFSKKHDTYIIAYCVDINSFFTTNERMFFWETKETFETEALAAAYFRKNIKKFAKIRNEILKSTGGWSTDAPIYFQTGENIENVEKYDVAV